MCNSNASLGVLNESTVRAQTVRTVDGSSVMVYGSLLPDGNTVVVDTEIYLNPPCEVLKQLTEQKIYSYPVVTVVPETVCAWSGFADVYRVPVFISDVVHWYNSFTGIVQYAQVKQDRTLGGSYLSYKSDGQLLCKNNPAMLLGLRCDGDIFSHPELQEKVFGTES